MTINVHKGKGGYGIYFTNRTDGIYVSKLDKGSEAEQAGVQPQDRLVCVQDNNRKFPLENPGMPVNVDGGNYHEILHLVRNMNYCKMMFVSVGMQKFLEANEENEDL